jgi:hypothetical protein
MFPSFATAVLPTIVLPTAEGKIGFVGSTRLPHGVKLAPPSVDFSMIGAWSAKSW